VTSSYQAKIDLIVTGLEKIKAAETRIKNLVSESRKLKRGSTAQRGTVALATVTRAERQASQRSVRIAERKLTLQSQLNAATDLYNRKLREFTRAGGESNSKLQGRVAQIKQAFQAGTRGGQKNIRLVRALGTELGRVVEKQRESNRLQVIRNKGLSESRRGFDRIKALRDGGVGNLTRATTLVQGVGEAAQKGDQVAYNEAVRKARRALNSLERAYKNASAAQKASTKAKRDVEKAEKRLAAETKKAETASKARRRARKQKFTDIATGFGFPLLFGGGPIQALAGGIGGAAGGLGGSIAASAIAAQVEQVLKASAELGQALNPLTLDLERVAEASGFAGTETQKFMQKIEQYGEATEAARLATALLETKVGKDGVKALKDFGEDAATLGNNLNVIFTQVLAAIAKAAGPLLDSLAKFAGEQVDVSAFLARTPGTSQEKLAQEILKASFTTIKGELTTPSSKALRGFSERSVGLGGQGFKTADEAKTFARGVASSSQRRIELPVLEEIETLAGTLGPEPKTKKGRKSRLPQLQAEVALQERLAVLAGQIAKAKADEDPIAQAALEREIVHETKATQIAKINLEKIPVAEKIEKIKLAELAADRKIFNINNQLKVSEAARAKQAANILESLQNEQDLVQAQLDGRTKEEQIKQQIARITKSNTDLSKEEVRAILEGTEALREKLTLQQQQEQLYLRIGQTIQSGIVGGIQSAIDGSKSLGESLSGVLKQLGGIFLQAGIGNFGVGGKAGSGLLGLLPFAEGGYVSSPTNALIGEGGEPEYVIPESKMRTAMSRYSRGSRGDSVISGSGATESTGEGGGGGTAVAAPIDVRYTVERINSVDYVTADQFQTGMQQAAQQGAKQGEQQTLKRLQMSGSTRKRIGI